MIFPADGQLAMTGPPGQAQTGGFDTRSGCQNFTQHLRVNHAGFL